MGIICGILEETSETSGIGTWTGGRMASGFLVRGSENDRLYVPSLGIKMPSVLLWFVTIAGGISSFSIFSSFCFSRTGICSITGLLTL